MRWSSPGIQDGIVVLDLVDLGSEAFVLDEAAQRFRVADDAVLGLRRDEHAGAQAALIVLAGERVHLPGALQVDVLALGLVQNGTLLIGIVYISQICMLCFNSLYEARRPLHASLYPRSAPRDPALRPPPDGPAAWLSDRRGVYRQDQRSQGQASRTRLP